MGEVIEIIGSGMLILGGLMYTYMTRPRRTRLIVLFTMAVVLASFWAGQAFAYRAVSTMYCLQGRMANGNWVHYGAVASNYHPLGTRLTVNGQRYVVEDRIGWGTELDIWTGSCATAIQYGRRVVTVTVGWKRRPRLVARVCRKCRIRINPQAVRWDR